MLNNYIDENLCLICKNNLYIFLIEKFEEKGEEENIKYFEQEEIQSIKEIKKKKQNSTFDKNDICNCCSKCILI